MKEEDLLKDLHKRMAEKSEKEDRAKLAKAFMEEHYGVSFEEKPMVQLSDDQVRMIVSGAADEAKRLTKEETDNITRKYGISHSEATGRIDEAVNNTLMKRQLFHDDCKMAAEVIKAIAYTATGRARPGMLHEAYEKENDYLRKTGRESRAMSVTTDSTGGYLGGEIFETMLYENVARHSLARKYCTVLNMEREILRIPKLTATVTAEQTSEAGTITSSQPTFDQFVLNTKKINVLTKPFSVELFETADPALVPAMIEWATREIAKKEDSLVFQTSAPGLLSHTTNNKYLGGASTSGSTAITDTTFDDIVDLVYELDPQYIPDEDIQGSGLFTSGAARFWVPQGLIPVLAKSKGNDQYHWANVQELKHDKMIHGFEVKRVPSMSSAPSADTRFAVFGDLGKMVCGVRPGFRIELQSQGTVDSVNLNETNSYAVRVTEFFDNDSIDDESFSILRTAAS